MVQLHEHVELLLGGNCFGRSFDINFTEILESSPSQRIVYWEAHTKAIRGRQFEVSCYSLNVIFLDALKIASITW